MIAHREGLKSLLLETEYRTGEHDLVSDFLAPCLQRSIEYDRAAGYFRSTVYTVVGEDVLAFAQRGGKLRVICSPYLSEEDSRAIAEAYEERKTIIIDRIVENEVQELISSSNLRYHAEVLATLIKVGALELRIAVRPGTRGIFHEKLGVFRDCNNNSVTFKGSINETWNGWHLEGNFESFEVFCSWRGSTEASRVHRHEAYFNRLWEDKVSHVKVIEFSKAAKEQLLRVAKPALDELQMLSTQQGKLQNRALLPHQADALATWKQLGSRGILEHATGSGKTLTALTAVKEHLDAGGVCLILVPSKLLLKQWRTEIRAVIPDAVVLTAGANHNSWRDPERLERFSTAGVRSGKRVILATMQTASSPEFLRRIRAGEHLLVVADEVHQVGSPKHSEALNLNSGPRLGLSATPQRFGDPFGTQRIFSYFGPVVPPPVTLRDAINSGRLVEYEYHPHPVSLTSAETTEWKELTKQIISEVHRKPSRDWDENTSERLRMLLIRRARIAKGAVNKIQLAVSVLSSNYRPGQRWLVYCEDGNQLERVRAALLASGLDSQVYHSKMVADPDATLGWYRAFGGILVAIRCLDEGVDIPEVSHALILASSQNPRQFIQRRGRVLRVSPGKAIAFIHDALVLPGEIKDEPEQFCLVRSEMRRAMEFAQSALNRSAAADLREFAMSIGVDPTTITEPVGVEEDESPDPD